MSDLRPTDADSVYRIVDLRNVANLAPHIVPAAVALPIGDVTLRGIPFRIGAPGTGVEGPCFVAFGSDLRSEPLRVQFEVGARAVVLAHVVLDSAIPMGAPIGDLIAEYAFELIDGTIVGVPIHEAFEIGSLGRPDLAAAEMMAWRVAAWPLLAQPDSYDHLYSRRQGPWAIAGRRLREVHQSFPDGYKLWSWSDPDGRLIVAVEIRPHRRRFLVAGLTLSLAEDNPLRAPHSEPVLITLPSAIAVDDAAEIEVVVDRGVASYVRPVLHALPEAFLEERNRGWGSRFGDLRRVYVEVAAMPSATIRVCVRGRSVYAIGWRALTSDQAQPSLGDDSRQEASGESDAIRIELVDRTRTWVHTTVVDAATDKAVPCRIHFRSESGIPYQPHGHHNHINDDQPSWHVDVGGDVRLGAVSYALIDGHCQGWLPEGNVLVEVVRGFEYEPLRTTIQVNRGQRDLRLAIRRWTDRRSENWLSGDTHVHFLSVNGAHLEAAAEDLDIVNLLQAQWGHLFTNTEEFTGRPSLSRKSGTIVSVGQENRQHMLGHLGLLGLRQPVMPWSSDGPDEAELGGALECTLSDWADAGRRAGALVTLPHFGFPHGEAAALIATKRVDAIEMVWLGRYFHEEYYRYLNAGYRLPLVGGTDKMTNEVPVGLYRTYAKLQSDEHHSWRAWARAVARGRTYVSAGPLLRFSVEGREAGDYVSVPPGGGTLAVEGVAESANPFEVLQVVVGGRVVAERKAPLGTRRLELRESLRIPSNSWVALRAGGPEYYDAHRIPDQFERGVFAHTSPVYTASGEEVARLGDETSLRYVLTQVEAAWAYVHSVAGSNRRTSGHPHGDADHRAHLERPFREAHHALSLRLAEFDAKDS